jgi:hypothetical protein
MLPYLKNLLRYCDELCLINNYLKISSYNFKGIKILYGDYKSTANMRNKEQRDALSF